jgi:hypothetical protein
MSYRVSGTDRILETSAAPGTGAVSLDNPVPGYRSFSSVLSSNDTCTYFIEAVDDNGVPTGDWERGFATFINDTGPQLVRSLVMDSSNSGNLVDFTSDVRVGSAPMSETIDTSFVPGGRLSVSATNPVSDGESDTLYYVPYFHDDIPLFNGYGLQKIHASSTSISVADLPANSAYDVFGYISSASKSTMSLELSVWTDPNTRKDGLIYANGFPCKASDFTRRYLGSFYMGTDGLLQDWNNYQGITQNPSKRFLSNLYNRVRRDCFMFDSAVNWSIPNNNQWRVIHGATPPQGCLEIFRGMGDDLVEINGLINCSLGVGGVYYVAIGLDSNSPIEESLIYGTFNNTGNKTLNIGVSCSSYGRPGIGYHTFRLLERLTGATATGGSDGQSGMSGVVFA